MGFVYILLSEKDKKSYTGSTDDIDRRLNEHNKGECYATKNRRPLNLIYLEKFNSLNEARIRERFFKTRKGRKELKKIFKKINIGA